MLDREDGIMNEFNHKLYDSNINTFVNHHSKINRHISRLTSIDPSKSNLSALPSDKSKNINDNYSVLSHPLIYSCDFEVEDDIPSTMNRGIKQPNVKNLEKINSYSNNQQAKQSQNFQLSLQQSRVANYNTKMQHDIYEKKNNENPDQIDSQLPKKNTKAALKYDRQIPNEKIINLRNTTTNGMNYAFNPQFNKLSMHLHSNSFEGYSSSNTDIYTNIREIYNDNDNHRKKFIINQLQTDNNLSSINEQNNSKMISHRLTHSNTGFIPYMYNNSNNLNCIAFSHLNNYKNYNNNEDVILKTKTSIYSLQYIDQNLTKLPIEANEKRNILNILDLSVNKLEYFPIEISSFMSLRVLKLDHNRIKSLPNEICNLKELEVLSIAHNFIQTLPYTLIKLSNRLIELNIESNLLETFNNEITDLHNLQVLNIYQNRIMYYPTSFRNMTNIKELVFEWFRYLSPSLNIKQKREEILKQFKDLCITYDENFQKTINFIEFLTNMSENQIDIFNMNDNNRSILHLAAASEDIGIIKFLLGNYPYLIDCIDKDNHTPLSLAINRERFSSARYLIKHSANPCIGGGLYSCPLHLAVRKLNYQLIRDILKAGEDINRQDNEGQSTLHHCISMMTNGIQKVSKICYILLENGANPNIKNDESWAPIHIAARKKDPNTINWIIMYNRECLEVHGREEIFKLNIKGGPYNWTPMHIAAYSNCPSVVALLGDAYVDIFKRSLHGYTPKKLIPKNGLTLKLIEKYEKKWLNMNIFKKNKYFTNNRNNAGMHDNFIDQNLQNLNKSKEIGNASKNKFDNSYLYIDNNDISCLYIKSSKFEPTVNKNIMLSKQHDDSDEIMPESEFCFNINNNLDDEIDDNNNNNNVYDEGINKSMNNYLEDNDIRRLDFCSDLNEDIDVEANINNRNISILHNDLFNKDNIKEFNKKEGLIIDDNNNNEIDYENFLDAYNKNQNFNNIEHLENQIKKLKDMILDKKLHYVEKLYILSIFKRLHYFNINNIIIKQYYYNISNIKGLIPAIIYDDMINKPNNIYLNKIIRIYDLVPKTLLMIFNQFNDINHDITILKCEICKIMQEFQYINSIDFLEKISTNKNINHLLRYEAFQAVSSLKKLYNNIQSRISLNEVKQTKDTKQVYLNNLQQLLKYEQESSKPSIRYSPLPSQRSHSYKIAQPQLIKQALPIEGKKITKNLNIPITFEISKKKPFMEQPQKIQLSSPALKDRIESARQQTEISYF